MNHCSISRKKEQRGDSIEGTDEDRERRRREETKRKEEIEQSIKPAEVSDKQ